MTTTDAKTCNFNCTCIRPDCSYTHYLITLEEREAFKKLFEETIKNTPHNEPDYEGTRKKICVFGMLCKNPDCGYKHFCDIDSRVSLRKNWFKKSHKSKNLSFLEELNEKYTFSEEDYEALKQIIEQK